MKRKLALLLVCALLLCGCGRQTPAAPTAAPTTPPTAAPTTPSGSAPTTAPTTPPTTAPTEPAYRHPLTGAGLEQPWSGQMVAVMVNNIKPAMPQSGLSQADMIFEMEEEGGATRNMALYSDVSKLNAIGSVRSARTYFVSVAAAYDAYLVHCGGSIHIQGGRYDAAGNKLANWKDIDEQGYLYSKYFYRDKDRYSSGYAWEHTLFTNGDLLAKALENKNQSNLKPGVTFRNTVTLPDGKDATEITVKFKGGKTTSFTYEEATGLYVRSQYGSQTIDAATKEAVKVKNVITLYTKQWYCGCGNGHQYYDTIGSGDGYVAIDGKIVPIKWSRATVNDPYTYTLENGEPLDLAVGSSYISIVGTKHPIQYK